MLYHMAWEGSWPLITKLGLLSSEALTSSFAISEPDRTALLSMQRRESVVISNAGGEIAVLRDQKPLSEKKLKSCLTDCDATTWYRILNERVFFWLNFQRLITLMSAAEYRARTHTIIYVDSASLVAKYEPSIEITHMNTGNTRPFAHSRGRSTFRTLADYPYESRRRSPDYSAIVELTIRNQVPDMLNHVIKAEHATVRTGNYQIIESFYQR
ncbi:MAG TPA: hypothetical protein VN634_21115 [Candidatus Limnocylindrales bacterium]|nr:hypothetical protein [Candidatus Limnocylindrales bacterium]